VLLDAGFAFELWGNDVGGEVIAVAREVLDRHLRFGEAGFDQFLNFS
jgi:hypothetical protein